MCMIMDLNFILNCKWDEQLFVRYGGKERTFIAGSIARIEDWIACRVFYALTFHSMGTEPMPKKMYCISFILVIS